MDRENVIRHIREEIEKAKFEKIHYAPVSIDILSDAIALLKQEAVVRCKDCKYYEPQFPLCKIYGVKDADWFCADGERKG